MFFESLTLLVVLYLTTRYVLRRLKVRFYGNKHVFITGCDTGFGNLLAQRLDKLGFRVYAGCLTEQGANSLKVACSKHLTIIDIDVTKDTSIQRAREQVERKLPKGKGLWAIVNNAGIRGPIGPVEWLPASAYRSTIEINLLGVIFVTKEFLPLVRRERGRVVNMSSICGRFAVATGPYVASKYGVEGFTDQLRLYYLLFVGGEETEKLLSADHDRTLGVSVLTDHSQLWSQRRELFRAGISVHLIEPGYFRTGIVEESGVSSDLRTMFEQAPREVQMYYGEAYRDEMVEKTQNLLTAILSPKINKVVDAYEHAITARFPKARYVVGWDAQIPFRILWNLPEWITDFILSRFMAVPEGARS